MIKQVIRFEIQVLSNTELYELYQDLAKEMQNTRNRDFRLRTALRRIRSFVKNEMLNRVVYNYELKQPDDLSIYQMIDNTVSDKSYWARCITIAEGFNGTASELITAKQIKIIEEGQVL